MPGRFILALHSKQVPNSESFLIVELSDLTQIRSFRGVGRVCRSTRGVVMTLARFDLARQRVELASLGNVESRLLWGSGTHHPVGRRGRCGQCPQPFDR